MGNSGEKVKLIGSKSQLPNSQACASSDVSKTIAKKNKIMAMKQVYVRNIIVR